MSEVIRKMLSHLRITPDSPANFPGPLLVLVRVPPVATFANGSVPQFQQVVFPEDRQNVGHWQRLHGGAPVTGHGAGHEK